MLIALLLAAGSSTRFGSENKLLTTIDEKPLCALALNNLLDSTIEKIVVVTGHDAEHVRAVLQSHSHLQYHKDRVSFIHNTQHANGMGSSIAAGLKHANEYDIEAALICLGDMPYITSDTLNKIIEAYQQNDSAYAFVPQYESRSGNPVLIRHPLLEQLSLLKEDKGARDLLRQYDNSVSKVSVETNAIFRDVDTLADIQP